MAYANLSTADVGKWDTKYHQLEQQFPTLTNPIAKRKTMAQMETYATRVEERINRDMRTVQDYFEQHKRTVNQLLAEANQEIKYARSIAAKYKKDPRKTEYVPQLKHSAKKLGDLHKAMKADALDFGQAWFGYRGSPTNHIPRKHLTTFFSVRSRLMNEQKVMSSLFEQVKAMQREAASLVAVAEKATMKADIKRNQGQQRPIADAQRIAADAAAQVAKILQDLQNPKGTKPQPTSITSGRNALRGFVQAKNYSEATRISAEGMWKNAEAAYKAMLPKVASMETLYANAKKALRSNELTDNTVKLHLASIAQAIKTAKTDLKKSEGEYKEARSYFSTWQSGYKRANKK